VYAKGAVTMKKIDLGQTISILANVGVIFGLIFVGLQLRQDRELEQLAGTADSVSDRHAWADLINSNSNSDVWIKGANGEPLTAREIAEFDSLAEAFQMRYFSEWFRASRLIGGRPPETFALEFAEELIRSPGLLTWWEEHRKRTSRRYELIGESQTATGFDESVDRALESLARHD
jgi:hypothetical protein